MKLCSLSSRQESGHEIPSTGGTDVVLCLSGPRGGRGRAGLREKSQLSLRTNLLNTEGRPENRRSLSEVSEPVNTTQNSYE